MVKSKYKIEEKFKSLTERKIIEDISKTSISNYDKAWIEVLEIALRIYQYSETEEYLREMLLTHLNCITKRIQGEILDDQKDLTGGWVTGTIDAIRWIFLD